jgi:hypothetical protein
MALEIVGGQITSIQGIVNPDKLAHLGPVGDFNSILATTRTRRPDGDVVSRDQ